MKVLLNLILLLLPLTLSACQPTEEIKPQEPLWEKEPCSRCKMILSEKRYAVQRILKNGEIHFYDDLNCALAHHHKDNEGTLYVRPFGVEKWVLTNEVSYQSGLRTPMGSGIGAVKESGNLSWQQVKEKFKE